MQFSKTFIMLPLIVLCITIPVLGYANCPTLDQVTFKCFGNKVNRHCNWSAPWWDGYHGDVEPGDHPIAFKAAFWGASNDPETGSVVCFYMDRRGNRVELSQNSWGGIAKPTMSPWRDGVWPSPRSVQEGKICNDGVETCKFLYGN